MRFKILHRVFPFTTFSTILKLSENGGSFSRQNLYIFGEIKVCRTFARKEHMRFVQCLLLIFSLSACGKFSPQTMGSSEDNGSLGFPDSESVTDIEDDSTTTSSFKPSICSDLSFDQVQWPKNISSNLLISFALSMNISGSFEGHDGWNNISNNFDGQGLSLGLFNQNLGQGSLQPLLFTFRDSNTKNMPLAFSSTQIQQVNQMLNAWGDSSDGIVLSKVQKSSHYLKDTSPLDKEDFFSSKASDSTNQASVDWAVATLYNGSSFKTEWKTSLQKMAALPEFVTLQVAAAKDIHNKTVDYMVRLKFKELRAYLFFYDVVVQNGGVTSGVESQYLTWYRSNPNATESTRLKKILEYRLNLVRSEYVNDVRARKLAVIDGSGTVHGASRNFVKEYCSPSGATPVR